MICSFALHQTVKPNLYSCFFFVAVRETDVCPCLLLGQSMSHWFGVWDAHVMDEALLKQKLKKNKPKKQIIIIKKNTEHRMSKSRRYTVLKLFKLLTRSFHGKCFHSSGFLWWFIYGFDLCLLPLLQILCPLRLQKQKGSVFIFQTNFTSKVATEAQNTWKLQKNAYLCVHIWRCFAQVRCNNLLCAFHMLCCWESFHLTSLI